MKIKSKQYIKGPDFTTGGIIYGTKGINKAFETGNGRITLTCEYKIVEQGKKVYWNFWNSFWSN